jgi:hypothetical protein
MDDGSMDHAERLARAVLLVLNNTDVNEKEWREICAPLPECSNKRLVLRQLSTEVIQERLRFKISNNGQTPGQKSVNDELARRYGFKVKQATTHEIVQSSIGELAALLFPAPPPLKHPPAPLPAEYIPTKPIADHYSDIHAAMVRTHNEDRGKL